MVMDATQPQQPSPQSVGREFVRQYYTLLNRAPNHLHRFYNNSSSFIHGESTLVVGQKNIYNRIQQLNFHDCHAKISQVDAQATLGNGVVVQVTGELSNDGQPMRRFTQTFVLAAQTPKKYYVHNDIFRYQDVYTDEENDGGSRSENDDEHDQQSNVQSQSIQSLQPQPQQGPTMVVAAPVAITGTDQNTVTVGATTVEHQPQQQQMQATVLTGVSCTGAPVISQHGQAVYYSMTPTGGHPVAVLPPPHGAAPIPLAANFATAATNVNGVISHEELMASMQHPQQHHHQHPQQQQQQPPPPPSGPVPTTLIATAAAVPMVAANNVVAGGQATGSVTGGAGTLVTPNQVEVMNNYQQTAHAVMPPPGHIIQQQVQQQPSPPPQQQLPQQQTGGIITGGPNVQQQVQQQQQQQHQHQQQQQLSPQSNVTELVENGAGSVATTINSSPSSNSNVTGNNTPIVSPNTNLGTENIRPPTAASVVVSGRTGQISVGTSTTTATTVHNTAVNTTDHQNTSNVIAEDFRTINEQQQQEKYEAVKQQQNEPKTYANLFKSSNSSSMSSNYVNSGLQQPQLHHHHQQQQQHGHHQHHSHQQQHQQSHHHHHHQQQSHHQQHHSGGSGNYQSNAPPSMTYSQSSSGGGGGGGVSTSSITSFGGNRNNSNNMNNNESSSMRSDTHNQQMGSGGIGSGVTPLPQRSNIKPYKEYERRTSNAQQFTDSHQLFLGNIPHHASEEDLKVIFARFGNVLDLRIVSKSGGKLSPGVRNPLNYGFITYDDPEAVVNCLSSCPLYFPETGNDRQKLNVEEKKARGRGGGSGSINDLPPRQSMPGGGGAGMNSNSNNMNNQRNLGGSGLGSRSMSNSGGGGGGGSNNMMRGNNMGNMSRGGANGPRMGGSGGGGGGGYNRNNSNSGPGSQMRSGGGGGSGNNNNSNNNAQSSGNNYGGRR